MDTIHYLITSRYKSCDPWYCNRERVSVTFQQFISMKNVKMWRLSGVKRWRCRFIMGQNNKSKAGVMPYSSLRHSNKHIYLHKKKRGIILCISKKVLAHILVCWPFCIYNMHAVLECKDGGTWYRFRYVKGCSLILTSGGLLTKGKYTGLWVICGTPNTLLLYFSVHSTF